MTLIKEHKNFIESLKLKYPKVSREGVIIHLIDNNFKELCKKEIKEVKQEMKGCDSDDCYYTFEDYIKNLEEVIKDGFNKGETKT